MSGATEAQTVSTRKAEGSNPFSSTTGSRGFVFSETPPWSERDQSLSGNSEDISGVGSYRHGLDRVGQRITIAV